MSKSTVDMKISKVLDALSEAPSFEDVRLTCPITKIPLPSQTLRATLIVPRDIDALTELLNETLNQVHCACGGDHTFLVPVTAAFEPTGEIVIVNAGVPEADVRAQMDQLGPPFDKADFVEDYRGLLFKVIQWLNAIVRPYSIEVIADNFQKRPRAERIAQREPVLLIALRELADARLPIDLDVADGRIAPGHVAEALAQAIHCDTMTGLLQDLFDEYGVRRFAGEVARIPSHALSDRVLSELSQRAAERLKPISRSVKTTDGAPEGMVDEAEFGPAYLAGLKSAAAHMLAGQADPQAARFAGLVRGLWKFAANVDDILPNPEDAPRLVRFEPLWDSCVVELNAARGASELEALLDDMEGMFTRLGMKGQLSDVLKSGIVRFKDKGVGDGVPEIDWAEFVEFSFDGLAKRHRWNASPEESEMYGGVAAAGLTTLLRENAAAAEATVNRFLEEALAAQDFIAAFTFGERAMEACGKAEAYELSGQVAQILSDIFSEEGVSKQLSSVSPNLTIAFWNECGNTFRYIGLPEMALTGYKLARGFLEFVEDEADRHRQELILTRNEAIALRDMGRFSEALPPIKAAADAEPDSSTLQLNLAVLYMMVGDFAEAVTTADRAVTCASAVTDLMARINALSIRAQAHRQMENWPAALRDFGEAMQIAPAEAVTKRQRIAAQVAEIPEARTIAPVLVNDAETVLRQALEFDEPLNHQMIRDRSMVLWGLGTLLVNEGRDDDIDALENGELMPFLAALPDFDDADWRLKRLKGQIERRRSGRWTKKAWNWLSLAAIDIEGKVPTGADASFAASWLTDKEHLQTELAEAGVAMVKEGNTSALSLIRIYEFANGRELSAALDQSDGGYWPGEQEFWKMLADTADAVDRPLAIFAFLDVGERIQALKILPEKGICELLPGDGWESKDVAAVRSNFARAINKLNPIAPQIIERKTRPCLDLLDDIGRSLAAHIPDDALVCFLPGRGMTNLPLHLMELPDERGALLQSHPVLFAANLALLLAGSSRTERSTAIKTSRLLVAVPKEADSRAYRLRLACAARRLSHSESAARVNRLSGRRGTPEHVLSAVLDANEMILMCHGAAFGPQHGDGLYLSDGRDLPPGMSIDLDVSPQLARFALFWSEFAKEAHNLSLVVSLACSSARVTVGRGGARLGPDVASTAAGAGAVIAPLWNVDQDASLAWLDAFETARNVNGTPQPLWEAYRAACLHVRQENEHFFFWGPFVLSGSLHGGYLHARSI